MGCSDLITLQRLLDGELDETAAELVSHHADSCERCRDVLRELAAARTFVQAQLGDEDEGEDEAASAALAVIAAQLSTSRTSEPAPSGWWRRTWLTTAAMALLGLLLPLPFGSKAGASPEEVLRQVVARERIWAYQPNKVLHWEVETVSKGIRGTADGRWRTVFSQKNSDKSFAQISRQFDPDGRTTHAYWQHPDGSSISYRAKTGLIEIWPSTAAARHALPAMTPELRDALESFLRNREATRALDVRTRRDAEWLHRPSAGIAGTTATLRDGRLDGWGDVHHITIVKRRFDSNPEILRAVHEYDVEAATYRLLRLQSKITYADGTVGVHDSRWAVFRETSAAEFDAQTPKDLLDSGLPLVRLTPLDVARRRLQEINRERERTN